MSTDREDEARRLKKLKNDLFHPEDMKTPWLEENRDDPDWTPGRRRALVDELNRRYDAGEPGPKVLGVMAIHLARDDRATWGTAAVWGRVQRFLVDTARVRHERRRATWNPDGDVRDGDTDFQVTERQRSDALGLNPRAVLT